MTHSTCNVKESKFIRNIRKCKRVFIDLDVHKRTYLMAVYSVEAGIIGTVSMPSDNDALIRLLRPVEDYIDEAGPTGFSLCRKLLDASIS